MVKNPINSIGKKAQLTNIFFAKTKKILLTQLVKNPINSNGKKVQLTNKIIFFSIFFSLSLRKSGFLYIRVTFSLTNIFFVKPKKILLTQLVKNPINSIGKKVQLTNIFFAKPNKILLTQLVKNPINSIGKKIELTNIFQLKPNPINSIGKKSSANEIFKYFFFFHIFFRYLYGNPGSFISGLLLGQPPIIILFGGSNPSPKQLRNYYYTVHCTHDCLPIELSTLHNKNKNFILTINTTTHHTSHQLKSYFKLFFQQLLQALQPIYLIPPMRLCQLPALYSDIKPQITKNIRNTYKLDILHKKTCVDLPIIHMDHPWWFIITSLKSF